MSLLLETIKKTHMFNKLRDARLVFQLLLIDALTIIYS